MASSLSPAGRVRPLEMPDPRRADCARGDVVVRSPGPGESSSVRYDPQELAFMAYVNDPVIRIRPDSAMLSIVTTSTGVSILRSLPSH